MENTQPNEKQLLVSSSILDNLPSMVRNELARLPVQKQEEFVEEYKRKAKSTGLTYVLWLVLFFFGAHYIYLRRWGHFVLFWVTAGEIGIWWIIDAFRIPSLVQSNNKDVATDVLRNLKAIST